MIKRKEGMAMGRIRGERVTLQFANKEDKKRIYEMLVAPEVIHLMFDEENPAPSWKEFDEGESDDYYSGEPSMIGNYLLINLDDRTIGSVSYSISKGKKKAAELDIWISSAAYLGKGLGVEALNETLKFVQSHYQIKTFIIRPWVKNSNAIKAYKKCGFKEMASFDPADFYCEDQISQYGEGDYGEETANLIFELEEQNF